MGIRLSKRFTKFVCLICFIVLSFKFYYMIMETYKIFKNEKDIKSQSLMLPFNIRRENFYTVRPVYTPPLENKDIVINVKGKDIIVEEVVNSIRKESQINLPQPPITVPTEESVTTGDSIVKDNSIEKSVEEVVNETSKENIKINNSREELKETENKKREKEVKITGKSYYIQIGIYKDRKNAEKIALKAKKYQVTISEEYVKGQKLYRASVEGFQDRESAMAVADGLRKLTAGDLPIVRVRY